MATHLAFLRAINLGARRKFPKDAIRGCVEGAGFGDVGTYINTGNVGFRTRMRSRERIEATLEAAFLADRGFEVPTIVFTTQEFAQIAADADELAGRRDDLERHYVLLLKDEPAPEMLAEIEARSNRVDEVVVRDRAAHLLLGTGHADGTTDPVRVERLLGVTTSRNVNVVRSLAERWCR